ncbi:polyphosphate polymerase domain-containing protein [Aquibacillus albus]|uniref:VTC domain-containing protein n=1 Tax=Aquibacillus albus TaxID=1168171 RepID=A0ABS2MWC2_9BACI|nr:polyphosphate polymerase domain-containing protein [Aquibacillus albus]MBM7570000.1 hypothetical protein [Aquibacillus albus]
MHRYQPKRQHELSGINKKFRHELKYYINQLDYEILRKRIGTVLPQDKHAVSEKGYLIRSLYFDNIYDDDLYQKSYGLLKRKKIRIRTYNKSDSVIKLERKHRYGEYICKESAPITRAEYSKLRKRDYQFLRDKEGSYLYRDFYLLLRSERLTPKVIVDYTREAYVGEESEVRITFDKQLSASTNSLDVFNPSLVTKEALTFPKLIMEVKFNEYLPSYIRRILHLDSHERSAISKYVICREAGMDFFKQ